MRHCVHRVYLAFAWYLKKKEKGGREGVWAVLPFGIFPP